MQQMFFIHRIATLRLAVLVFAIAVSTLEPAALQAGVPTALPTVLVSSPNTLTTAPKPLNLNEVAARMELPAYLREAGIAGDVVVRVQIDENGNYVSHEIVRSAHPQLARFVARHLPKLSFTPAYQNGTPVASKVLIPFRF